MEQIGDRARQVNRTGRQGWIAYDELEDLIGGNGQRDRDSSSGGGPLTVNGQLEKGFLSG